MTVSRAYHTEFIRVGTELFLESEAVLQRLTRILALQRVILLDRGEVEVTIV